jgi:hypothetical protein
MCPMGESAAMRISGMRSMLGERRPSILEVAWRLGGDRR